MTAIEIGEGRRAGLFFRFMEWRRSRKERGRRPDITAVLDGLNAHLLRDMGYHRDAPLGLRKRSSAERWIGRTPPGWHDI